MAIQYSGSTYVNSTFTPTTRADVVNNITSALSTAGWTTISGTPGSGSDVTMETAAANQGQKVRLRCLDPGSGNCAQFTLKHSSGSPTSQTCYLLPASILWRVIANKFTVHAFQSGSSRRIAARATLFAGVLYVPSFITLASGDGAGFIFANGINDTDSSTRTSWRNQIKCYDGTNATGNFSGLWVATMTDMSGATSNTGVVTIPIWSGGYSAIAGLGYRWEDNSLPVYEPLVAWGTTSINVESRIKGQLYDAMVMNGPIPGETTFSFDSHNFMSITDLPVAAVSDASTLYVAIT